MYVILLDFASRMLKIPEDITQHRIDVIRGLFHQKFPYTDELGKNQYGDL